MKKAFVFCRDVPIVTKNWMSWMTSFEPLKNEKPHFWWSFRKYENKTSCWNSDCSKWKKYLCARTVPMQWTAASSHRNLLIQTRWAFLSDWICQTLFKLININDIIIDYLKNLGRCKIIVDASMIVHISSLHFLQCNDISGSFNQQTKKSRRGNRDTLHK